MDTSTEPAAPAPSPANTDGGVSPSDVLQRAVENAKKSADADGDLIGILEKYVLKVDAKDNAVQLAASEIEKLAAARATKTT